MNMVSNDMREQAVTTRQRPRLATGHSTLAARDLAVLRDFYCNTLGFEVTNEGPVPGDHQELLFLSQDPSAHHQIVIVGGAITGQSDFVMVDHLAFRTGTLDDLRLIHANLVAAGVQDILQIDHGNSWSLYFHDPEGNGVECYVDTSYHVAQPYADKWDITAPDDEIKRKTLDAISKAPEFQPMTDWSAKLAERLDRR